MAKNANLPISEVAERTRLSPEACSKRFHNLLRKGVIRKTKAVINYDRLGFYRYLILMKLNKFSNEKTKDTRSINNNNNIFFTVPP